MSVDDLPRGQVAPQITLIAYCIRNSFTQRITFSKTDHKETTTLKIWGKVNTHSVQDFDTTKVQRR